ncbi:MAG: STAS domain-containing protein [bacterium]|nr:MAG: STAS domain-containing protein [bacterium]
MEIHVEQQQDKSVITLDQNIIVGSDAAKIQNTVLDSIKNGSKTIVFNLSKLDYITSWGIGALIHALTTCTNRNIQFYLTGVNDKVAEILKKVKLDKIFTIEKKI